MKLLSPPLTAVMRGAILLAGATSTLDAAPARLLKDTNPDARQSSVISYNLGGVAEYDPEFRLVNGIGYFTANDGIHGAELWRTDGTAAGTFLTADLYPGELGGVGRVASEFADVNGRLLFDAQSWLGGSELHISSGTPATTIPLRDLNPNNNLTTNPVSHPFLAGNGRVQYFSAPAFGQIAMGRELWRTDGTKEGTLLVKNIAPDENSGVANANTLGFSRAGMLGDVLLFAGYDETAGVELWRSDGTEAGTVRLKDIAVGADFFHDSSPSEFHRAGNLLYFAAGTTSGRELWRTDGTADGTFMLTDVTTGTNPGTGNDYYSSIGILVGAAVPHAPAGDAQFIYKAGRYVKRTASDGSEIDVFVDRLMLTHGDASPSVTLAPEIHSIAAGPIAAGNFVWVMAYGELPGPDGPVVANGLWRVTPTGATFVAPGTGTELTGTPTHLFALNSLGGLMSFNALTGQEIAGATIVYPEDGNPPYPLNPIRQPVTDPGTSPRNFFAYGERLFFTFDNGVVGEEPWISDGTAGGTFLLKDVNATTASSFISAGGGPLFLDARGRAVFRGTNRLPDTTSLYERLFISDGTTAGTQELSDPRLSLSPAPWGVELGGRVLYGDEFSLVALEEPAFQTPVPLQLDPQFFAGALAKAGNQAFFTSNDYQRYQLEGVYEQSLWRTDGTLAGTRKLTSFIDPQHITIGPMGLNEKALFFTQRPGELESLWVSDGTVAGTRELMEMEGRNDVTVWGNSMWFRRSDGIWKTDGTVPGTQLAVPFIQGSTTLTVNTRLVVFKNALWFGGTRSVAGVPPTIEDGGLFRSDGTAAGTTLVVLRALPSEPVVAGNYLYWIADQAFNSNEFSPNEYLHRTDGTLTGTQIVKVFPHESAAWGIVPNSLCAVGDDVFFCFGDLAHGAELWRSNGTATGTNLIQDINPGAGDAFTDLPFLLNAPEPAGRAIVTKIGTKLYFWADSSAGREPWVMDAASVSIAAPVIGTLPVRLLVYLQEPMHYTVPVMSDAPVTWAAHLPPGLKIDSSGGISGYPMWTGNYAVTLDATNDGATGSAVLNIRVVDRDALFPRLSTSVPGVLQITTGGERNAFYNVQTSPDWEAWTTIASGLGPDAIISVPRPAADLYVRSVVQFQ